MNYATYSMTRGKYFCKHVILENILSLIHLLQRKQILVYSTYFKSKLSEPTVTGGTFSPLMYVCVCVFVSLFGLHLLNQLT